MKVTKREVIDEVLEILIKEAIRQLVQDRDGYRQVVVWKTN